MTITEFLLARIAEDDAWVRDVGGTYYSEPYDLGAPAHHERLLAECEAKRRIVARHSETVECGNVGCQRRGLSGLHCLTCDDEWPCPDLRDLALPYADHPDYDEAWRP